MARGPSPLARAQARALRALVVDASPPAASPESSVSVMAPPSTSVGAGGDSPPRPPPAGVAEASAPSSPTTASTGDASGAGFEPSFARPVDALSPVLGAAPRSAADAPEAALGIDSADSQPQGSVSSSGVSGDGARSAANAPEASSAGLGASRFSSVRWEDIEDIVTTGTDRTVWQVQVSTQSHFLGLVRLVVDLNHRPPLRTDYEFSQRLEAAGSLSDVFDALAPIPRSPAPWEYELTELRDEVASLEARLAASEASLRREVDLRLKAERLCNQASHERNAALENLRRIRLDHGDAARQFVATNIVLEQSSQAAAALEQRCRRLDKSLADIHKVIRHDREQFKTGISSYAAQLRQLREYLEQSDRQSSASGGASSASASALPAAFATFLEELGSLQLAIPPPPAASGSSEGSGPTPLASSGSLGGAAAKSGSSTSLTVDFDNSDDSGPIIPSALHKGKVKRPAKSSAKLRSAPPTPKKKQRLGLSSVNSKARTAAKQAASVVVSSSGPPQSVPFSLPAASPSTLSAPIAGIAVSADSDVLLFSSISRGSDPPFSPIPRAPTSPASSTASTASLPSTPVVSRGITPGTEASVPVEIDDDGGSGADGAASEASAAPGGNEAAPDTLVLDLEALSNTPAATQASVAWSTSIPAESAAVVAAASAAVVTSTSARRRVANTHTGPVPPARVVATPTPRQASASRARTVVIATLSTMSGTRSTAFEPVTAIPAPIQDPQPRVRASRKLADLANPLLEPAFTAPRAQEAWCEILNARIPQPIASVRVIECSIAGIQAFADWEDPVHPWQRLRAHLPESPCTFGADGFMPDKPISIRASGLAIVVKLWRQFTGRAVRRSTRASALPSGSAPTRFRLLLSSNGSGSSLTGSGRTRPIPRHCAVGPRVSDARAQAAADASAAIDSPSDASSARIPIPAADQADVQAELGATAPAQARLDVLTDLATTAEI
ncbi:unnamed protein product [Phytophthora fragariaefolia]|uniref:Unnamed protein product n=1 Tax=Phytophthora fragariaefolia TaxID=1490495 RepID=A0A9W7CJ31_9STRA|nr:unnamed protein product [Phytophthora fragariaefolia]